MIAKRFNAKLPLFIVTGLTCYQLVLCYLNTHGVAMNNGIVAAAEGSLLIIATLCVLRRAELSDLALPVMVFGYFCIMWVIRGEIDPQGLRNVFIIYVMFMLGSQRNDIREANIILCILSVIVIFFSFFEYFQTDLYTEVFNILQYYTARGLVTEEQLSYLNTNLYTSGMRPSGRSIMPFLGDQRVSSVFLEPVSMGNYAVIVAMWALSFNLSEWRRSLVHFICAAFFIIACDSRFASLIIFVLIMIRLLPVLQQRFVLYIMPVVVITGQAYFASLRIADWKMDDLPGRLAKSGNTLLEMPLHNIFGIGSVDELYDMGVPYSLVVFGVGLCAFLWLKLVFLSFETVQGKRMRAMLATYCMGLLLISGTSFYSSKTAGILWFLMGVLYTQRRADATLPISSDSMPSGQNPPGP